MKKNTFLTILTLILGLSNLFAQDIKGKVVTGYQGWFSTPGNNFSNLTTWRHWGGNHPDNQNHLFRQPMYKYKLDITSHKGISFDLFPDMSEYSQNGAILADTGFNDKSGNDVYLFDSADPAVTKLHFKWMRDNNIDVAALQRFAVDLQDSNIKSHMDAVLKNFFDHVNSYGRKFYIMYDISSLSQQCNGGACWKHVIENDFNSIYNQYQNKITDPNLYAHETNKNGESKPVICLWGLGVSGRIGTNTDYIQIIDWFKNKGFYVIGGLDQYFYDTNRPDQASKHQAYKKLDMISPWYVNSFADNGNEIKNFYLNQVKNGLNFCKQANDYNSIDFMPVVFPGFSWYNLYGNRFSEEGRNYINSISTNLKNTFINDYYNNYVLKYDDYENPQLPTPNYSGVDNNKLNSKSYRNRDQGNLLWKQISEVKKLFDENTGQKPAIYFAMFDEYDESTAIAKAANNENDLPEMHKNSGNDLRFLSYRGVSKDFYLRMVNHGSEILNGNKCNQTQIPTQGYNVNGNWSSCRRKIFDVCDSNNGWVSGSDVTRNRHDERNRAIERTNLSGVLEFSKNYNGINSETTINNGYIEFYYYSSKNQPDVRFEISSKTGSQVDSEDLEWSKSVVTGWQKIVLYFGNAINATNTNINLSSIKSFRVFNQRSDRGIRTVKLDDIFIGTNYGTNILLKSNIKKDVSNDVKKLSIFPNPVNDILNILLPNDKSKSLVVTITDISGRTIDKIFLNTESSKSFAIDITKLKKGVYFLETVVDKERQITKFLKN